MSHLWTGKVFIATSLDGFIARPDGNLDWLIAPQAGDHVPQTSASERQVVDYDGHMADVDAIVMGRGTYDTLVTFDEWPFQGLAVVVLSTKMASDADARITVVGSLDAAIAELDRISSKTVYIDGGQVIQAFLRAGLVSELVLTRAPVILGAGLPLFGALDADILLDHLGTDVLVGGMISSRYRVR